MSKLLESHGYQVVEQIGCGAFGTVYHARDRDGVDVAVKVIHPELAIDPALAGGFLREGVLLRQLTGGDLAVTNVVSCRRVLADNDEVAFVMDFVSGGDLADYLKVRGGTLAPSEAFELAARICDGLEHIHVRAGLAHRDIKPSNILLMPAVEGTLPTPLVADFGIASVVKSQGGFAGVSTSAGTAASGISGTVQYAPPEANFEVDGRDYDRRPGDLYSVGCILYELLCGFAPFPMATPNQTLDAHRRLQPVPIPGLAPAAWTLLASLLHKRPRAPRPTRASEAATALRTVAANLHETPAMNPWRPHPVDPEVPARQHAPRRRWRRLVIAGLGVAVVIVALTIVRAPTGQRLKATTAVLDSAPTGGLDLAPVLYANGLTVQEHWELSDTTQTVLRASITVGNTTQDPLTTTFTETIPKTVAQTASQIQFSPTPDRIVQSDPVVEYSIEKLSPNATKAYTWNVAVNHSTKPAVTRIEQWIADRKATKGVAGSEISFNAPSVLTALTLTIPARINVGDKAQAILSGTLSNGQPAPASLLTDVRLSVDNNIITIDGLLLTATSPGTTTITASIGTIHGHAMTTIVPLDGSAAVNQHVTSTTTTTGSDRVGVTRPPSLAIPGSVPTATSTSTPTTLARPGTTPARPATTLAPPGTPSTTPPSSAVIAPLPITELTVTPGDGKATLAFTDPQGYVQDISYEYRVNGGPPVSLAIGQRDVTGLQNGTSYSFEVRACNTLCSSTWSNVAGPVVPYGLPGAPSLTVSHPSPKQVQFDWTDPANNGRQVVVLQYKLNGDPGWNSVGGNRLVFGSDYNQTYTVSMRAVDDLGQTSNIVTLTGSTDATPKPAVTISRGETFPPDPMWGCVTSGCAFFHYTVTNFPPNAPLYIQCWTVAASQAQGPFWAFTSTLNSGPTGTNSYTTLDQNRQGTNCIADPSSHPGGVYLIINGVKSNIVTAW